MNDLNGFHLNLSDPAFREPADFYFVRSKRRRSKAWFIRGEDDYRAFMARRNPALYEVTVFKDCFIVQVGYGESVRDDVVETQHTFFPCYYEDWRGHEAP